MVFHVIGRAGDGKISELASRTLNDGDDLIVTDSFRPVEDAPSTLGIDSRETPSRRRAFTPRLSGFSGVSSRVSMSEYVNEKAPPKLWKRLLGRRRGGGNSSPRQVVEQNQVEFDGTDLTISPTIYRRPPTSNESFASVRSNRLNVATGRNLLVRQKAQVVGKPSAAAAQWEVDSLTEAPSIARITSLSFDDNASFVSHLTEADMLSRPNSRMMYFGPGPMQVSTQQSLLGSPREDDEDDDDDELEVPEQAPVFVYDSPSLISRPSTAFRRHLQLDNVEEDEEDGSGDEDFIFAEDSSEITDSLGPRKVPSRRIRLVRDRATASDPSLLRASWKPPSPLVPSSDDNSQRQRSVDSKEVSLALMDSNHDRIFPDMEYECGAAPKFKPQRSLGVSIPRPKAITRTKRATSAPDTDPIDQPPRPKIFTGTANVGTQDNNSLWTRRMTERITKNDAINEMRATKTRPAGADERADALIASWNRWLSDPEIDVLADHSPEPGQIKGTRSRRSKATTDSNRIEQRPRVHSDSEVSVLSAASPPLQHKPSLGLAGLSSRPRVVPSINSTAGIKAELPRPSPQPRYYGRNSYFIAQQQLCQNPRKQSESEITTRSGNELVRPRAQSRNRDSFEFRRSRILSDSEITVSSFVSSGTQASSGQNRMRINSQNDSNSSNIAILEPSEELRPRIFSDSELTVSTWASSLRDNSTNNEEVYPVMDLSSPKAVSAARQVASSMGRGHPAMLVPPLAPVATAPPVPPLTPVADAPPVIAGGALAAAASNSRCRDYYWNNAGSDPVPSPQGAGVPWSESTDSFDIF